MVYPFLSKRYEIVNQIGQGSFGVTYLAKDNKANKLVVIKVIKNEKLWVTLKENETLLCSINNEHIMHIFGIETLDSFGCILQ